MTRITTITPDALTPQARLAARMKEEQALYHKRLLESSRQNQAKYAFELSVRNMMLRIVETEELSASNLSRLLMLKNPLAIMYYCFDSRYDFEHSAFRECMASAIENAAALAEEAALLFDGRLSHLLKADDEGGRPNGQPPSN